MISVYSDASHLNLLFSTPDVGMLGRILRLHPDAEKRVEGLREVDLHGNRRLFLDKFTVLYVVNEAVR